MCQMAPMHVCGGNDWAQPWALPGVRGGHWKYRQVLDRLPWGSWNDPVAWASEQGSPQVAQGSGHEMALGF